MSAAEGIALTAGFIGLWALWIGLGFLWMWKWPRSHAKVAGVLREGRITVMPTDKT